MKPFVLTTSNRQHLIDKLNRLDPTVIWEVTVRERKSKRTLEQNKRLWDLYGAIGEYIGEDKDKVHELMGYKFLRYQDEIAGQTVELIKSTTKLSTKEMTEYQEAIERWAASIGFLWEEAA
jgi:hypothetical protein